MLRQLSWRCGAVYGKLPMLILLLQFSSRHSSTSIHKHNVNPVDKNMTRHSKTHVDQVEKDVERGRRLQAWNNLGDCTFVIRFAYICDHLWICCLLQQLQAAAESLRDPTLSKQRRRMMLALVEAKWVRGQLGAPHGTLLLWTSCGAVSQVGSHGLSSFSHETFNLGVSMVSGILPFWDCRDNPSLKRFQAERKRHGPMIPRMERQVRRMGGAPWD